MFIELSRDREGRAHLEVDNAPEDAFFEHTFAGGFVVREEPHFTATFTEDAVMLRIDRGRGVLEILELPGMAVLFEGHTDSQEFLQSVVDELAQGDFPRYAAYSDQVVNNDMNNVNNNNSNATMSVGSFNSLNTLNTNLNENILSVASSKWNGGKRRRQRRSRRQRQRQRQHSSRNRTLRRRQRSTRH